MTTAEQDAAKRACELDSRTVRERVRAIEALAKSGDHEAAHSAEDELWHDVLLAITSCRSVARAKALAEAALLTQRIDIHRWCA